MIGFDRTLQPPLLNLKNVEEFYNLASIRGKIDAINVPTLIIHCEDD